MFVNVNNSALSICNSDFTTSRNKPTNSEFVNCTCYCSFRMSTFPTLVCEWFVYFPNNLTYRVCVTLSLLRTWEQGYCRSWSEWKWLMHVYSTMSPHLFLTMTTHLSPHQFTVACSQRRKSVFHTLPPRVLYWTQTEERKRGRPGNKANDYPLVCSLVYWSCINIQSNTKYVCTVYHIKST